MSVVDFARSVNAIYEKVVTFRKNLFNIPSGKLGNSFVKEMSFWIKQFDMETESNIVSMKAFMILPALLLQKPSARSMVKEHVGCLERRLRLWKAEDLGNPFNECQHIQTRLTTARKKKEPEEISRIFSKLILEGKIKAAINF